MSGICIDDRMKDFLKSLLTYIGLIGMCLTWLIIFSFVLVDGKCDVYEPNPVILTVEIAICTAILALGIERVRNLIKVTRSRKG